jgi:Flp pilus assembly protein TadG
MFSSKAPERGSRRAGVATVEFAFVAVLLGTLAVGMIEVARALMIKETLSNAARCSCRAGILPTGSNATIIDNVNKVLADHNISSEDATVQITVNDKAVDAKTAVRNDKIAVRVSIPAAKVSWITPMFLPGSTIGSETTVMMRQR